MEKKTINNIVLEAKKISRKLAGLDSDSKNQLLLKISENVKRKSQLIGEANAEDVNKAEKLVQDGLLTQPLLSRLKLNDEKIEQLSTYLEEVAKLADPVGDKQYAMKLSEDLELVRVSCPIGVVAIIFESRPEVVIQVTALSLKSGNVVILKGGREAGNTNEALYGIINEVLDDFGLKGSVNLIETREDVAALLNQDNLIDLIIPRGSNEFVKYIQDNTKIPVIGHSSGICHIYLDNNCDTRLAVPVITDAKIDYPSACNAVETLLVNQDLPVSTLVNVLKDLQANGVQLRACKSVAEIAKSHQIAVEPATDEDWMTEYNDLILAVKMVSSNEEAVEHINNFGSHHTDSIITNDKLAAEYFLSNTDSGCVFHNVSTRFSDGYVFGLGAEVGISTNKTHSRGPVGLEGMVIYKYILRGKGQTRAAFSGSQGMQFLHQPLPIDD
jgi:glutamate-5-semialdehyde dehydrogenase